MHDACGGLVCMMRVVDLYVLCVWVSCMLDVCVSNVCSPFTITLCLQAWCDRTVFANALYVCLYAV